MRPLTSSHVPDSNARTPRRLVEVADDGSPGRPVALRGFNLSGAAKNPDNRGLPFSIGLANDIVARAQDFLPDLAADGFDLLRLPIVWEFLQPSPDAPLDAAAVGGLRALAQYAGTLGFRIIVDIHQDLLSSYFRHPTQATWHGDGVPAWIVDQAYAPPAGKGVPHEWVDTVPALPIVHQWALNYSFNNTLKRAMTGLPRLCNAFGAFATQLAVVFAGLDNILAYEVLNEPYSPCMPPGAHVELARAVRAGLGAAVRNESTPTWSVMPAGDWLDAPGEPLPIPHIETNPAGMRSRSSLPVGAPLSGALGPGYWLLTPHFYDPRAGAPDLTPEPSRYASTVEAASEVFEAWDVVPVVGEFGCDAVKRERDACHKAWIDLFEQRCWSWCLWDFNPDAGPDGDDRWCDERYSVALADEDGDVQRTPAYFALLRPFPRRYGGPLLSATFDGKTWRARVGQAYRPGWRTEIYVPRSLGAFQASAGVVDDRVVLLDTDAGPADVTIALAGA